MTTLAAQRKSIAPRQHVALDSGGCAWVILTGTKGSNDLEVDQICGSEREARKEIKDLKGMGCDDARARRFPSWSEAEDFADKLKGY